MKWCVKTGDSRSAAFMGYERRVSRSGGNAHRQVRVDETTLDASGRKASSDEIRLARSHVRPLPVAHKPMNLVILNMCVTSEASMSLSCGTRGRGR